MADLPTNLKDDILDSSVNTRRKYNMIENPDGTVEFEDVTEYSQVGDEYGAGLINETNKQVNARVEKAVVVRDLDTIGAITQPGFIPDALALKDVNESLTWKLVGSANGTNGVTLPQVFNELLVVGFATTDSFTMNIPFLDLEDTKKMYDTGYSLGSTNYGLCQFSVSKTVASIRLFILSGADVKASGILKVYYR